MTSARAGTLLALVVAGWPLYQLVTTGGLDLTSALLRVTAVAAICAYGVGMVVRLAFRFEAEAEAARRKKLSDLYTEMESAVAEGSLTDPDESGAPDEAAPPNPV